MTPKNNGVCVKKEGATDEERMWVGTDEVSTGDATGGQPFHDITC